MRYAADLFLLAMTVLALVALVMGAPDAALRTLAIFGLGCGFASSVLRLARKADR